MDHEQLYELILGILEESDDEGIPLDDVTDMIIGELESAGVLTLEDPDED
jgi:hypothetical protein